MSGRYNHPEGLPNRKQVFANAASLAAAVPAYRLNVSLTGRFWEKIEDVLGKGDSPLFSWQRASEREIFCRGDSMRPLPVSSLDFELDFDAEASLSSLVPHAAPVASMATLNMNAAAVFRAFPACMFPLLWIHIGLFSRTVS